MFQQKRETALWEARLLVFLACVMCLFMVALSASGWAQQAATAAPCPATDSFGTLAHKLQDKTKSVQERRDAAGSLALVGQDPLCTDQVVNVLIKSLVQSRSNSEGVVRAAASRSVGVIFQSVKEPSPTAIQVAVPALVTVLRRPDPDPMVRANAAWALGQLPEHDSTKNTVLTLINTVKQTHVNVGEAASLSLIGMSKTAVPELQSALSDPDANFRWKVAWILGQMGEAARGAVTTLAAVLNNPKEDPNVRGAAAWAIGSIGRAANQGMPSFRNMIASLTELLKNSNNDANIRSNAAWALGRMGPAVKGENTQFPAEVTAALETGLADSDSDIRRNAAWALGQINPNPQLAVPALTGVLQHDPDRRVRLESAVALGQIGLLGSSAKDAVNALSRTLE